MYSGIDSNPNKIKALLKKFGFRLYEVIGAQEITERFHPHVTKWNPMSPHVTPCFGYIAAEKVRAGLSKGLTSVHVVRRLCPCWGAAHGQHKSKPHTTSNWREAADHVAHASP
jgi:hypothetical protein